MSTVQPFPEYPVIGHQFQYSGGVAAEPGFRIERARFTTPAPLAAGFDAIEAYFGGIGRSPTAFCACELRSGAIHRRWVRRVRSASCRAACRLGDFPRRGQPRSPLECLPEIDPPTTPSFYAFSYTVPSGHRTMPSFVAAGSGEASEGPPAEHPAAGIISRCRAPR
jgi:hypothetical protein